MCFYLWCRHLPIDIHLSLQNKSRTLSTCNFDLLLFPYKMCHTKTRGRRQIEIYHLVLDNNSTIVLAIQDFVILTQGMWRRSSKFPWGPHLGRPTINKLITLGGQVPLHFTPWLPPTSSCEMTAQCLCLYLSLALYIPREKPSLYSFLSIVALFQQHPSHPYNVGKGPKTIISWGGAKLVQRVWTAISRYEESRKEINISKAACLASVTPSGLIQQHTLQLHNNSVLCEQQQL